jgi:glycosyltransferase involved in cell wall biosynthesis
MKIFYISPSTLPSRSANSIHVVYMCEALSKLGHEVVFFLHSNSLNSDGCLEIISDVYGVSSKKIKAEIYNSNFARGKELGIAFRAVFCFIKDRIRKEPPEFIISRNLFAAVFLGLILKRLVVYETHTLEKGIRRFFQNLLLSSNKVETVVISAALKNVISGNREKIDQQIHILHDAARDGRSPLESLKRKELQKELLRSTLNLSSYEKIVGYFGHLYSGRGIEVIEELARVNPQHIFFIYGGNEDEIEYFKCKKSCNNFVIMGHLEPNKTFDAMSMMDVLLMPYQQSVSIGLDGVDTAKWMSPMKMFEYMSVGVPIISSDLPVLREVLVNLENCLLVKSNDVKDWSEALRRLSDSKELSEELGTNAYKQYLSEHTWEIRAKRTLAIFSKG